MFNRSAITLLAKQPMLDWINHVETQLSKTSNFQPTLNEINSDRTVYLLPPTIEDEADLDKWLKKNFSKIFELVLEEWYLIEEQWPKKRTYTMFKQWFTVEQFGIIEDLTSLPFINED